MSISARRFQRAVLSVSQAVTLYSLWPFNPTPSTVADPDATAIELGVKFSSSSAASVTGVRFYKGSINTGTHTGSLWTSTGTLLATVTFSGETASGWQVAYFASPVSISANTTYVVSYFTPSGHYASNANYFASTGVTSGILVAPATSVSPNGIYAYNATSTFPNQSFNATNYWVDVIVAGTVDTVPPSAPTGLSGSANGTLVSMTWVASTDNIGVMNYRIYRDSVQIGTSSTTNYTDNTASASTLYAYTVCAVDYGNNLSTPSNVANITTSANAAPTASFIASPAGLTLYVDASSSSDPDGTIASYAWNFGDSGTATGQAPNHIYSADGTYTVTLTVTDNVGATGLTSQNISVAAGAFVANVINNPHIAGYPDETNTGVPAGTVLTASGSITVNTDGTILDSLDIAGDVTVNANNVIIRKCRITTSGFYPVGSNGTNLLIEDSEIIGTNSDVTSLVAFSNYTARRVNIHGAADGFKAVSNVLIEDCFVHTLAIGPSTHNDGTQTTGGSNVTIRHSTYRLGDQSGINACLQIGNEGGNNDSWLVENNLFDGGGWIINASNNPAVNTNFQILNNRFTHRYAYGVGGVGGATWTGNYFDNDGTPA